MRRASLLLVAAGLAATVVGCGGDESESAAPGSDGPLTVRVAKLVPLTGAYVEGCKPQGNAFDLAVEHVNARGKVRIEVVESDVGQTPPEAIAGYERAKREGVDVINTTCGASPQAVAEAEAAANDGLLQFGANSASLKASNPDGFNTLPLNEDQLPLVSEAVWKQFGSQIETVAFVVASDYSPSVQYADHFREFFDGKGVETVAEEKQVSTTRDFSAVAGKLKSLNPDLVVADLPIMLQFVQQLRVAGYEGLRLGGAAAGTTGLTRVSPEDYEGWIAFQNWNPEADDLTATAKRFAEDYTAEYGSPPEGFAAAQYDGVLALEAAVLATRSTDSKALADWLRSNEGPEGVTAPRIRFNDKQAIEAPMYLTEVRDDGYQTPIAVERRDG